MAGRKIEDLREHLFATLEGLRDKESPMDVERAKAIAEVAREITASAKVEVDHMKIAGGQGSGFLAIEEKPPAPGQPRLVRGKDMQG